MTWSKQLDLIPDWNYTKQLEFLRLMCSALLESGELDIKVQRELRLDHKNLPERLAQKLDDMGVDFLEQSWTP